MQFSINKTRRTTLRSAAHAALALGLAFPAVALAQESAAEPDDAARADRESAEIIVTASRVQRDGFDAPTPTTIVSAEVLEARGATNVATVLNEIPSFKASQTPSTTGVRAAFAGSFFADMRGLSPSRTLVLVDGNRFVPQIVTGIGTYQIDLNQIPALLLERAEVVTGGASAQWGSDAVAGVVNLIMRKDFEGFKSEVQAGVSELGDNAEYRVGLLGGFKLGERGHFTLAIDHVTNEGVGDVFTRDWGRRGFGLVANPSRATNGLATQLILPDVRYSTMTNGGLINNTTGPAAQLRGIFINPDQTLGRFQYGNFVGASFMQGGGSNAGINFNTGVSVAPEVKRWTGYARASYEIADNFTVYAEASYANTVGRAQTLPPRNEQATPIVITLDNPFIPAALRAEISRLNALPANAANQITSFNLGRNSTDIGYQRTRIEVETKRGVVGFDAGLGDSWKLNGAAIYGENLYTQQVFGNRIQSRFRFATDVVQTANGPACRAVVAGNPTAAGCQPLNVFGQGSPSAAAIAYATGTTLTQTLYKQFAANLNLSGEPFDTWAGPVSVAAGAEYRREEQDTTVDAIAEAAGYESSNARSLRGDFNVKEAYLEAVVPLARDIPLLRSLDVQGAVRVTDYSSSGGVTTWKLGATWEPFEGFLMRGSISRDIRAPNIFELFTPAVTTVQTRNFAASISGGPAGQVPTANLVRGNSTLSPEKSETKTLGMSYSPPFIPGLQFSVDYFDIRVENAVAFLDVNQVINFCAGVTPTTERDFYCSFITRSPAGSPTVYTVDNPYLNLGYIQRRGFDFDASYRLPLDRLSAGMPGALTARFSGTYYDKFGEDITGTGFIERAGDIVGSPRFLTNSSLTYDDAVFTLQLQMRTISSSKYNNLFVEGVQINDNSVPSRTYFNLSSTFRVSDRFEFFGVVNNLTDKDPPLVPQNFGYPTTPQFFDMIGRSYRFGARVRF